MVSRTATYDFQVTNAADATTRVLTLADALDKTTARGRALAQALPSVHAETGTLGTISSRSAEDVKRLLGALGPLGVGLGQLIAVAPKAAFEILGVGSASRQTSEFHSLLNSTILTGSAVFAAGAVAAAAYSHRLLESADAYQTLQARIKTYTATNMEAAEVEANVFKGARGSRQAVEGQTRLFSRLAPEMQDLGKSPEDAVTLAGIIGKALTIQGATGQEATYGVVDLIHALGTGQIQGRQLRGLQTEAPVLLRYIAQNLDNSKGGVGVPYGQLSDLAAQKQLTSEKVIAALLRAQPQIEKDFATAPKTAAQGWQVLTDQIMRAVGQLSVATGAQSGVVKWLADLATGADAFRQKMMLDPHALDPIREAQSFIGGSLQTMGHLGEVAFQHFDEIVKAGELIIALKLGETFAGWFSSAAAAARQASTTISEFAANARYHAGAAMSPEAATTATNLRTSAMAADLRATTLAAQADAKAAEAAIARTAADKAVVQASIAKADASVTTQRAAMAEAEATALTATADRASEQAKKAQAAATAAGTAATARNAIALEAEAAVTAEVTVAQTAANVVKTAALGLYNLLGGGIGVASIAIGGLIYAIWQANAAWDKEVTSLRESVVASDNLRAVTDSMTASTWAQIPALEAHANALRHTAEAQMEAARAKRQALQEEYDANARTMAKFGDAGGGLAGRNAILGKRIEDLGGVINAGQADEAVRKVLKVAEDLNISAKYSERYREEINTGKDFAGRPIDATRKTWDQGQIDWYRAQAQGLADQFTAMSSGAGSEPMKKAAASVVDAIANVIHAGAPPGTPVQFDKPPKKIAVPGGVTAAYDELLRQEYLPTGGQNRFALQGGQAIDSSTGNAFVARSRDEAAAAAKYVEQINAINTAKTEEIAKTGQSREALRQAASARLDYVTQTSQASQAEDRWADMLSVSEGSSRAVVKAEQEIYTLRVHGAVITDQASQAYIRFVEAQERAKKAAAALQFDSPIARKAVDRATADVETRFKDARGVTDAERATRDIESRRGAIIAASQKEIEDETRRQAENDGWTETQLDQELSQRLAANRLAVETALQSKILDVRKKVSEQAAEYDQKRVEAATKEISSALKDLVFGADPASIGKRIGNDLLSALYDELIGNPLKQVIHDLVKGILNPEGGSSLGAGANSLVSGIVNFVGSIFSGGFAGGGWISAPGGPRDDRGLARVSDGEFIVNASSAQRYGRLLEAINGGALPAFAGGGWTSPPPNMTYGGDGGWHSPAPATVHMHVDLAGANGDDAIRQVIYQAAKSAHDQAVKTAAHQAGPAAVKFMRDNFILSGG